MKKEIKLQKKAVTRVERYMKRNFKATDLRHIIYRNNDPYYVVFGSFFDGSTFSIAKGEGFNKFGRCFRKPAFYIKGEFVDKVERRNNNY